VASKEKNKDEEERRVTPEKYQAENNLREEKGILD